ncbi:MAG: thioredoxin-like domain-containing protein [Bacteroidales bacterium]|jgi:thiol-disulfide isomerase/thioredoxin
MTRCRTQLIVIFTLSLLTLPVFSQTGYEIKVRIPALKDSNIILAHHFAKENTFNPDDTIKLDNKGSGNFKGSKPLTGGMYIILFPTRKYFDLLLGENQYFSVVADTGDLLKGIKFQGSVENDLFYGYRNLIGSRSADVARLNEIKKQSTSDQQKDSIATAIEHIGNEVGDYSKRIISENPQLFISVWLKSLQDIVVPDFPRDASGNVMDSAFKYNYWHAHFLDNFNLADPRLLSTPFYEGKLKFYLEKVIPQHPDSIMVELDRLIARVKGNKEIFNYVLGFYYGHVADLANKIVGMDAVFVYYTEKYFLPNATWVDKKTSDNIKLEIARIKPNLIGQPAPEIPLIEVPADHFLLAQIDSALRSQTQIGKLISLKDIEAKFLVLVFWEVDCGHCMKEMPVLHDSVYPLIKDKGAKILAIQLISGIDGKRKWVDFINKYKMYDWINAVPASIDYKDLYGVYSTPTIYILDRSKRIISKRIGVEQIEGIIKFESQKKSP